MKPQITQLMQIQASFNLCNLWFACYAFNVR